MTATTIYSKNIENCLPFPTLFIHGNLASTEWWFPSLEIFKGMRTIDHTSPAMVADIRGCGQSPDLDPNDRFTIFDLADDFISVVRKSKLEKVNIVGHSVGGLIALAAMIRSADTFHRAVLLDPVGAHGVVFNRDMYDAFEKMAGDRVLTAQVILGTIYNRAIEGELRDRIVGDAFRAVRAGRQILEMLKDLDLTGAIRGIQQSVLVLHGEFDSVLKEEDSKALASLLPHGEFEEVKGHGHCLNIEDPERFAEIVVEFLAREIS